jgi:hypothetical protein
MTRETPRGEKGESMTTRLADFPRCRICGRGGIPMKAEASTYVCKDGDSCERQYRKNKRDMEDQMDESRMFPWIDQDVDGGE